VMCMKNIIMIWVDTVTSLVITAQIVNVCNRPRIVCEYMQLQLGYEF